MGIDGLSKVPYLKRHREGELHMPVDQELEDRLKSIEERLSRLEQSRPGMIDLGGLVETSKPGDLPMEKARTPKDKLNEIQKMAKDFNESLQPDFKRIGFNSGGNLFLGRFYAESDRIYFGLNPGPTRRPEDPFLTCLEDGDGFNRPFRNSSDFNTDNPFGREFQRFLTAHPDLDRWFNNKVTSAFLCPWRTENRDALYKLNDSKVNDSTKDKLFKYSSQLVWKMIEHHDAKVIVVVALNGVMLFNELFLREEAKAAWDYKYVNAIGKSPGYAKYCVPGKGITLLQIPRFNPARRKVLDSLADWLRIELRPFGL